MKTEIPLRVLAIENDGFHLLIKVLVNNKKANMLIDTGASKTVFDKNRINNFVEETQFDLNDKLSTGLGTNTMESHIATIRKIRIGDITISNYKAILLDLGHVNHSYQQLSIKPIDGVIGSDILKDFRAVINFGKEVLKLSNEKPGKEKKDRKDKKGKKDKKSKKEKKTEDKKPGKKPKVSERGKAVVGPAPKVLPVKAKAAAKKAK
jgi:hypothetical protein